MTDGAPLTLPVVLEREDRSLALAAAESGDQGPVARDPYQRSEAVVGTDPRGLQLTRFLPAAIVVPEGVGGAGLARCGSTHEDLMVSVDRHAGAKARALVAGTERALRRPAAIRVGEDVGRSLTGVPDLPAAGPLARGTDHRQLAGERDRRAEVGVGGAVRREEAPLLPAARVRSLEDVDGSGAVVLARGRDQHRGGVDGDGGSEAVAPKRVGRLEACCLRPAARLPAEDIDGSGRDDVASHADQDITFAHRHRAAEAGTPALSVGRRRVHGEGQENHQ